MAKRLKKKALFKLVTAFTVVIVAAFGAAYLSVNYFNNDANGKNGIWQEENTPQDPSGLSSHKRFNILLLGTDARPGDKVSRTDTMILASIDQENKKIALLSIPRDTLVHLPKYGDVKINSASEYGGVELAKSEVEKITGTKIKYWAKTNFNGFQDIIDTLGGVTIDVEKNMRYRDPSDGTNINLKKGVQRLQGKEALDYARFRHDALGDISRTQRQQKMLKAVANEMLKPGTILKLPKLVPEIMDAIDTNLTLKDALGIVAFAKDLKDVEIVTQTLPGKFLNHNGSYWQIDEQESKLVLNNMLLGITTNPVQGEINIVDKSTKKPKPAVIPPTKQQDPTQTTDSGQTDTQAPTDEGQNPAVPGSNGEVTQPGGVQPANPGANPTGTDTNVPGTSDSGTGQPGTPEAGTTTSGTSDSGTNQTGVADSSATETSTTGTGPTAPNPPNPGTTQTNVYNPGIAPATPGVVPVNQ